MFRQQGERKAFQARHRWSYRKEENSVSKRAPQAVVNVQIPSTRDSWLIQGPSCVSVRSNGTADPQKLFVHVPFPFMYARAIVVGGLYV